VAGGAGKGVFKFMKALFGLETIVDDILSGRAGPTPEEKIEHAKEDIVAEKAGAAAEKVESEKDRLAQADEQRRALAARLAVMFPGETLEQIERRQRQEHEQDTDRGRERGR
jgi:cell division protein FtsN